MARGERTRVEAQGLIDRLNKGGPLMQKKVTAVVARYTDLLHDTIKAAASKPVDRSTTKGGKKKVVRSKSGQAPRKDTGRLVGSIKKKLSTKGFVGTVSTGDAAQDKKGNRYPWMLESGTKFIKKRPLFKRAQRQLKKPYTRDLVAAARAAVRGT